MMRVEADQRLIEQQQPRPPDQRLRQQQALPLAAGGLGQRPARQVARADQVEHPIDLRPPRLAEHRQPQTMAVDRARDEVPAAEPHACATAPRTCGI